MHWLGSVYLVLKKHVKNIRKLCNLQIWNHFGKSALKIKLLTVPNWLTRLSCFKENRDGKLAERNLIHYSLALGIITFRGKAIICSVVAFYPTLYVTKSNCLSFHFPFYIKSPNVPNFCALNLAILNRK